MAQICLKESKILTNNESYTLFHKDFLVKRPEACPVESQVKKEWKNGVYDELCTEACKNSFNNRIF